ncbi:hypothetical protein JNM05_03950 [bacterium]|nr:hypothetical protein [bacterium]
MCARIKSFWIVVLLIFVGCLGVEKKEYTIKLKDGQSGTATVKYINIFSNDDDGKDVSFKDFGELVSDYVQGDKIERDYPGIHDIKKRLFIENNTVCGEITFAFDSLSQVRLYRFEDGPFMYYVNSGSSPSEKFDATNGKFGGDIMPVIFWHKNVKELQIRTRVTEDVSGRRNLVNWFKMWQSNRDAVK